MSEFNPYAAPEASIQAVPVADLGGVWRDGPTLVMARTALLPHRCVKCNAPARWLHDRHLSWYHPALYLLLLLFLLPGFVLLILVVFFVQKEARIQIPLCLEHRDRRRKDRMIAGLSIVGGLALCFTPILSLRLLFVGGIGVALILFGSIYGTIRSPVLTVRKITREDLWLNDAGPAYLDSLPPLITFREPASASKPKPAPFDAEL